MIKKIVLFFILILFLGKNINGQDVEDFGNLPVDERPRLAIFFTPTALLHPRVPATQFGVEVNLGRYISLVQEVGFIYKNQGKIINQKGYRIRSEFRVFLFDYEIEERNIFVGLQYRNWKFNYDTDDTFCRFDCLYQQRIKYSVEQKAQGLNISFGNVYTFQNGIQIELAAALGKVFRKNTPQGLPEDAELIAQRVNVFNRPNGEPYEVESIAALFWIKVGYAF